MRGRLRPLTDRIGHRGAFLLFLAVLDAAFGYSLLAVSPARGSALHLGPSLHFWGWAWIATGAVCAVYAFRVKDRVAFAAAAGLKGAWAAFTAWAWIALGTPQGWVGVVVWSAFAVTVLLVSSWPETPPPPAQPPPPVVPP